jgi:formylglycine-generating enzyme required for sulfatase activity
MNSQLKLPLSLRLISICFLLTLGVIQSHGLAAEGEAPIPTQLTSPQFATLGASDSLSLCELSPSSSQEPSPTQAQLPNLGTAQHPAFALDPQKIYRLTISHAGLPVYQTLVTEAKGNVGECSATSTLLSQMVSSTSTAWSSESVDRLQQKAVLENVFKPYFGASIQHLSEISTLKLNAGLISTTPAFHSLKNRINLLSLYQQTVLSLPSLQAKELPLWKAVFEALTTWGQDNASPNSDTARDEAQTYALMAALQNLRAESDMGQSDFGVSLMQSLLVQQQTETKLFLEGLDVWDGETLRQTFFEPYLFGSSLDLTILVDTPNSSLTGHWDAIRQGEAALRSQSSGVLISPTLNANAGQFSYSGLAPDTYTLSLRSKGSLLKSAVVTRQKASDISVSVLSTDLATALDSSLLSFSGNILSLKLGAIEGSKLAPNLTVATQVSANTLTLSGLRFPSALGSVGQVLVSDGSGNLSWATVTTGSSFSGVYADLAGKPALFSGNYSDLVDQPTIPVLGSNVMASDVANAISADWTNTAHPWNDAEVANVLTLIGGNISNSVITNASANLSSLVVSGSANLGGLWFPATLGSNGQVLLSDGAGNLHWQSLTVSTGIPSLTAGQVILGQTSGPALAKTLTGDISLSSTGVTSFSANAVNAARIADKSIQSIDLAPNLALVGPVSVTGNITVTGQANLSGALYPSSAGTSGQWLKRGSAGNLYWAADEIGTGIGANAITTAILADQAVTKAQLATSSVNTTSVLDGSLSGNDFTPSLAFAGNVGLAGNLLTSGSANFGGTLYPTVAGSANQFLMLGSNGNLVWQSNVNTNSFTAGSIGTAELANAGIGSSEIADGTVVNADLAADAVSSAKLATGSVNISALASNSVGSDELQDTISVSNLTVSANASLGTNSSNSLVLGASIRGNSGLGGNINMANNVMSSSNAYALGTAAQPFGAVYALDLVTNNLKSNTGELYVDSNADGLNEMTIKSSGVGIGTTTPAANLHVMGNMIVTGMTGRGVQTVTASTTLGDSVLVMADTTSDNITLTLPAAASAAGTAYTIQKVNHDNGYVRVVASDNIDGAGSVFMKNTAGVSPSLEVLSNGSTWLITKRNSGTGSAQGGYMIVDVSGGPTAPSYPVSYTNVTPDLTGAGNLVYKTSKIVLKWIEPGRFTMGNTTLGYTLQHPVVLTEGFWAGVFEVTQQQWLNVMGSYPTGAQDYPNTAAGNTMPLHQVSWEDIRGSSTTYNWPITSTVGSSTFMGNLLAKTGLPFDLPTEAEWEYTCRAGTITEWSFGSGTAGDFEWDFSNAGGTTHEVGGKLPNPWGLYDMHGNVFEWCRDWYASSYPTSSEQSDPSGASSGSDRVLRGGYFVSPATAARSAHRDGNAPGIRNVSLGLRLFMRPR